MQFVKRMGAPDYGKRKGTVAVVLHTTEGDPGRKGAIATATWQATAGNTSGGSYHEIIGEDGDTITVVRTVPFTHIAGSISTRRDSIWIADDDPQLTEMMGAAAVADPNAYVYAISIAGRTKDFNNKVSRALATGIARRLHRAEKRFDVKNIFVCGHYRFQSNRSDPGKLMIPAALEQYERLYNKTAPKVVDTSDDPDALAKAIAERDALQKRIDAMHALANQIAQG